MGGILGAAGKGWLVLRPAGSTAGRGCRDGLLLSHGLLGAALALGAAVVLAATVSVLPLLLLRCCRHRRSPPLTAVPRAAALASQDIAGLVKGASKGEGLGNQFLANIRECDSIVQARQSRSVSQPCLRSLRQGEDEGAAAFPRGVIARAGGGAVGASRCCCVAASRPGITLRPPAPAPTCRPAGGALL